MSYSLSEETHSALIATSLGPIYISDSDTRKRSIFEVYDGYQKARAFNDAIDQIDKKDEDWNYQNWRLKKKRDMNFIAKEKKKEREEKTERLREYQESQRKKQVEEMKSVTKQSQISVNVTHSKEVPKKRVTSYWNNRFRH